MWNWLHKLFGLAPPEVRKGISLDEGDAWVVPGGVPDYGVFFRSLPILVPEDAVLYLEDAHPTGGLREFLESNALPDTVRIAPGTLWPRPLTYHLPARSEFLETLAKISEDHAAPEFAIHIAVYCNGAIIFQSYDACCGDPLYISQTLPKGKVDDFCRLIGGVIQND